MPPPATKRAAPPARADPAEILTVPEGRLPPGADERDMPNAPAALPRSYDFAGWVKHEPVRVAPPAELAPMVAEEAVRTAMESYRLKSVAHCVYRYAAVEVGSPLLLDVLWIQAAEADDAFGLFSVFAAPPRTLNADGSQTAEGRGADGVLRLFGWQGDVCVRMTVLSDDDRGTLGVAARALRARLLFAVPRSDPPALLRLIPRDRLLPEREWLVRRAAALRLSGTADVPRPDIKMLDAALGLDGTALLAIAAHEVAAGESPNYVWIVRYDDDGAAARAAARYQAVIEEPVDEVDRNTMLAGPQGRFLAGTWTAEQESIQHLLPRLVALLPQ